MRFGSVGGVREAGQGVFENYISLVILTKLRLKQCI